MSPTTDANVSAKEATAPKGAEDAALVHPEQASRSVHAATAEDDFKARTTTRRRSQVSLFLAALPFGGSAGLFVGLTLGLSTTPLVTTVVGGVISAFATFMALQPSNEKHPVDLRHALAGTFCLVASIAVVLGIYVRTHNLLAPTPAQVRSQWAIALGDTEAANRVALSAYGYAPGILDGQPTGLAKITVDGVLYAVDVSQCQRVLSSLSTEQGRTDSHILQVLGDEEIPIKGSPQEAFERYRKACRKGGMQ
jgi:hypothetical protein